MPMSERVESAGAVTAAWARRRERVALHIERAALALFAELGAEEVTVERIAGAAGISVRTFFRYFPTRDAVLLALPRRQNQEMCRRVAARPPGESVLEAFIAAVREPIHPDEHRLVLLWGRAVVNGGPRFLQSAGGSDDGMVAAFGGVIADRLSIDHSDLRAQVVATAIASVMWFAFMRWLESGGTEQLSSVAEECFDVLADLNRHTGKGGGSARAHRQQHHV
jgi:AcrR family transcriptional regulator